MDLWTSVIFENTNVKCLSRVSFWPKVNQLLEIVFLDLIAHVKIRKKVKNDPPYYVKYCI